MKASLSPPFAALAIPPLPCDGIEEAPSHRHRTIWISDIHLGTPGCKAEFLLDFLKWNDADTLYLVGDIIDGWRLRKGWHWPQSHNDVIQKVLRKARKGTRVIYVPGNHDEFARAYVDHAFGGIEVVHEVVHRTADGRRLLVTHGDLFDGVVCGHIHKAEIRMVDGMLYCNDGDWVESLTALVEDHAGQLRIVEWKDIRRSTPAPEALDELEAVES